MIELLLYGYIGDSESRCDAASVQQWLTDNPNGDILVRINSPGGNVSDGIATYNMLARQRAEGRVVNVRIDSMAASMASCIAMVGERIEIADNALMMIHNPSNICLGDSRDMRANADLLDMIKRQAVSIYAKRSGQTPEKVAEMMDAETWMEAIQAVELGFATESVDQLTAGMSTQKLIPFDLTEAGFKHVPVDRPDMILVDVPKMMARRTATPPTAPAATQEPTMTEAEKAAAAAAAAAEAAKNAPQMTAEQIAEMATATARRNASIRMLGAKFERPQAEIDAAVDNPATTIETFMAACHEAEMKAAKELEDAGDVQPQMNGRITVTRDGTMDAANRRMGDRIATMSAVARIAGREKNVEMTDAQRELAQESIVDIAMECLINGGARRADFLSNNGRLRMSAQAIVDRAVRMRGMHTTADFPAFLAQGFQRVLGDGYASNVQQTNFQFWTSEIKVRDWREVGIVAAGLLSGLREIPEGGAFEQMTQEEYTSLVRLKKQGGDITFSLEAIENDDLGFFTDKPYAMGQRARLDDQKIAELALVRGTRRDGSTGASSSIFSVEDLTQMPEDHDLNVEALDIMTDLLSSQQEPKSAALQAAGNGDDRDYLNYGLQQLLVGRGLQSVAKRLANPGGFTPTEFGRDNIYAGTFEVYKLNYIDSLDYYGQDVPNVSNVVKMVSMRGKEDAEVYPIIVPDGLSMSWGVLKRRAAAIVNERGIVRGHQERPVGAGA